MHRLTIGDLATRRARARVLLRQGTSPEQIVWKDAGGAQEVLPLAPGSTDDAGLLDGFAAAALRTPSAVRWRGCRAGSCGADRAGQWEERFDHESGVRGRTRVTSATDIGRTHESRTAKIV
jgi:hypothetical protein